MAAIGLFSPWANAAITTEQNSGRQSGEETIIVESVTPKRSPQKSTEPQQLPTYEPEFVAVPFAFSSESLSTAFGGAGVLKHAGQIQSSILGIGVYSTNNSWVSYLRFNDYQIPTLDQWLFSIETYNARFKEGVYYVPNQADINGDSERVVTLGDESFTKFHARYVLPIGRGSQGAARSLGRARTDISWNPLESGVTSIKFSPFTQSRELEGFEFLEDEAKGVALELEWDNRDNGKNSTQGGQTSFKVTRDFGSDSRNSWTTWEFDQSTFVSIDSNEWFGQQILAFNFYLADTPTWTSGSDNDLHQPPSFAGVSLGGFERLRGYTSKRFTGRSAVLYSAEYRVQPRWQPLQEWPVFNLYDIPWWQWVAFAEAGQVSNEFSASALHDDLKWSAGIGARFEVESVVVRAELAFSEESNQFWIMVNQPF
ncbi:hypothetical protein MSG37_17995 [Shewanella sp. 1CM18E]|uniref:hypothetical protein n=1 Tax=Shewanella sp. 1CM18E TaxID=2929169 RepID=UPI0020C01053|nr:hypothetical protein [Shewanella sp. 1CM18E]MCK8046785.1 hypothetical protein [Shewanella sp. 1CM18E]